MTDPLRPLDTDAEPCSCEMGLPEPPPPTFAVAGIMVVACFLGLALIAVVAWWLR
jgi:hypothetical protein